MGVVQYPVLCAAVVIDATNNAIRFVDSVGAFTATLSPGTYFLTGNGGADDLLQAVADAFTTGSPAGDVMDGNSYVPDITTIAASLNGAVILGTDNSPFSVLWTDPLTTFPFDSLGHLAADLTGGNDYANFTTPSAVWVANQISTGIYDNDVEQDVAEHVTSQGQAHVFAQGDARILRRHRFDFIHVSKTRGLAQLTPGSAPQLFADFWAQYLRSGRRFYLFGVSVDTGTLLQSVPASDPELLYTLTGTSLERFAPNRMTRNNSWGWELELRKFVP